MPIQFTNLQVLRGRLRSSPKLRMLRGSQQKTNRVTMERSRRLRRMFRLSSDCRLYITTVREGNLLQCSPFDGYSTHSIGPYALIESADNLDV